MTVWPRSGFLPRVIEREQDGVRVCVNRRKFAVLIAFLMAAPVAAAVQARRVVDVVTIGNALSERIHEYAGDRVIDEVADGRTFRRATGWQRYVLTTYEDTEVTIACTFRGSGGLSTPFEVVVDGHTVPSRPLASPSSTPVTVEFRVPLSVTRGRTSISVTLRAVDGPTPGLMEMRTVQEHLELW